MFFYYILVYYIIMNNIIDRFIKFIFDKLLFFHLKYNLKYDDNDITSLKNNILSIIFYDVD